MSDKPDQFSRVKQESERPRDEPIKYVAPHVKKSALEKIQEAYREGPTGGLPKLSPEVLAFVNEGSTGDLPKAPDYQNEILSNYREGPTGALPENPLAKQALLREGPLDRLPDQIETQSNAFSRTEVHASAPDEMPLPKPPMPKTLERSDSVSSISSTISNTSVASFFSETNPLIRTKSEADLQKPNRSTSPVKDVPVKDVPVKDGKHWQNLVAERSSHQGKGQVR